MTLSIGFPDSYIGSRTPAVKGSEDRGSVVFIMVCASGPSETRVEEEQLDRVFTLAPAL